MKKDTVQIGTKIENLDSQHLAGVYADIAACVGVEMAIKMHEQFAGQQVTFPVRLLDSTYVSEKIKEEFAQGVQLKELSKKYDYSERRIRQIVKECQ